MHAISPGKKETAYKGEKKETAYMVAPTGIEAMQ
jgi:hypothetical protein